MIIIIIIIIIIISKVNKHKHLGLLFTPNLSWTKHIAAITAKANRRLGVFKKYKYTLSRKTLEIGYITFIRPILEYGDCNLWCMFNRRYY